MNYQNIFVIDDDPEDIEIFSEAIYSFNENISITAFTDASRALEDLKKAEKLPDIIFLDLQMPRLTGKDFLQEIKENSNLQYIPIIVLSGQSDVIMRDTYEKIGANNFICKPNSYKELVEKLYQILHS